MSRAPNSSLFDEIFRLQNPAPELEVDPEDQDHGLHASLVEGAGVEAEALGATSLRQRAAVIQSDPRYQGKATARKDLYSDDEAAMSDEDFDAAQVSLADASDLDMYGDDGSSKEESEEDEESDGADDDDNEENQVSLPDDDGTAMTSADASVVLPTTKSDDREKGKAVHQQLGMWDDLMRSRISLQKVVTTCNRLPQPDTWDMFAQHNAFASVARDVHSSVRKLVSVLLDLQNLLDSRQSGTLSKNGGDLSDSEITSESEEEDEESTTKIHKPAEEKEEDDEEDEESIEEEEERDEHTSAVQTSGPRAAKLKRKLDCEEVEQTLAKRHRDFQDFRNSTLAKWDEKTRLTHGKIRAKNFAAFEMSVLKQIEQVLVNRERLVRRIHQVRSGSRVLGQRDPEEETAAKEAEVDDDDEEVEIGQRKKVEVEVDPEIIDDSDFYHVCLRDLLETKQSEELDPVLASKQRLEIQRLRNKQKRKVDTRASKGRKIRYQVKEKLKNYMTPYDKSNWSEQQKDDLFKAVFGAVVKLTQGGDGAEKATINIGL